MVCLGNICRSPMAEGILRNRIEQMGLKLIVDSAGTADYHVGEAPDFRAIQTLKKNGIDISGLAARQFSQNDFDEFDWIYVMDRSNLGNVLAMTRNEGDRKKVQLIMDSVTPGMGRSVPDPYYGDLHGFDQVFTMLDQAAVSILSRFT